VPLCAALLDGIVVGRIEGLHQRRRIVQAGGHVQHPDTDLRVVRDQIERGA
jgi:hypothetical protein